eukprot:gb/GECH01002716.1/.p1 GENE.gb/GECH01002716.1/~~gb/GECH01002716.1/.p1  ORF type:complete len:313 (+),score=58.18 gb/GECH01002716.1/:1-939(+)
MQDQPRQGTIFNRRVAPFFTSQVKRSITDLKEKWRAPLIEFVGTAFFIFISTGTVVGSTATLDGEDLTSGRNLLIALAFGFSIATMVYATASVSGGHLNPAVTIPFMLTGQITIPLGILYVAMQIGGGIIASLVVKATIPDEFHGDLGATVLANGESVLRGFWMEFFITFGFVFTVYAVAVDPIGFGKLAPLAIGLAILIGHIIGAPFTGPSMNPARSFGPAIVAGVWDDHWIYWAAPIAGGLVAGFIYVILFMTRPIKKELKREDMNPTDVKRPDNIRASDIVNADRSITPSREGQQNAGEGSNQVLRQTA